MVTRTTIKVKCISKKESQNYSGYLPENPQTSIELGVDYNPKDIFFQMSGGTNMVLNTVNKEAADMFKIGKSYMMAIDVQEEPVA